MADEELRDQINEHGRTPIDKAELVSMGAKFDDDLTQNIMGEDTKYLNLANNIFKREMSEADLLVVTGMVGTTHEFEATWGFVATWYKVGTYPIRVDAFNSFQVSC